jgi:hypothetical protein
VLAIYQLRLLVILNYLIGFYVAGDNNEITDHFMSESEAACTVVSLLAGEFVHVMRSVELFVRGL